ncbi:hypothetical protein EPN18_07995 [bacterium]|nr:MAG: hypothetical protein EPN18_07995 [bacterium]
MTFDWKTLVETVAPTLATALGGPLAGMATQAISAAVLGKPDGAHDELSAALESATPDTLLKLKQAEQDFAVKMKELGIEAEKIAANDRDSARKREMAVKDKVPAHLAYFVFAGFFATLAAIIFVDIPAAAHDILLSMCASLGTLAITITTYYYGSSSGSAQKTAMIDQLMKKEG